MTFSMANLTSQEALELTLVGEARGEPIESIVAIGSVIRNRLHNNPTKYKSYRDVCLEPFQFSCWNIDDPNKSLLDELIQKMLDGQSIDDPYIRQCLFIGKGIADWSLLDNTRGSLHYMTTKLLVEKPPSWALKRTNELVRGNHTFFNV